MAILNRYDPYSAIPQLEQMVNGTVEKQEKTDRANELMKELLGEAQKNIEQTYKDLEDAKSTLGEKAEDLEALKNDVWGIEGDKVDQNGEKVQAKDENGNPLYDDNGDPIYETERDGGLVKDVDELEKDTQSALGDINNQLFNYGNWKKQMQENMDDVLSAEQLFDYWRMQVTKDSDGHILIDGQKIHDETISADKLVARSLTVTNLTEETENDLKAYLNYIRLISETGIIEIGEADSPYKIEISKHGMDLYAGDVRVAFFTTTNMQITNARILNSLTFGYEGDNKSDFAFVPQLNGNLSFKKVKEA